MKKCILIALGLAWITGCQPLEFPEPQFPDPVFYVKGSVNGAEWQLAAGKDDYFLGTEWKRDAAQVPVFISTLRPADCRELCPNSFQIQMRYPQVTAAGAINVDAVFGTNQSKNYLDEEVADSLQYQFKSNAQCRGVEDSGSITWDSGIRKSEGTETILVLPGSNPEIQYLAQDKSGTLAVQISQPLIKPTANDSNNLRSIQVNFAQDGRAIVIELSDDRDFTVLWEPIGSDAKRIVVKEPQTTRIKGRISWKDGNIGEVIIKLPGDNVLPADVCQAGFVYRLVKLLPPPNPMQLNTVDLYYMDQQGILFSTRYARQPDSTFDIVGSESFKPDSLGQATQKVQFRLNCIMADRNRTQKLELKNIEGVFAFAHPN